MIKPLAALRQASVRRAALFSLVFGGIAGCTNAPPISPQAPAYVVFFTPFSADLDDGASRVIAEASQAAQATSGRRVVVAGYADRMNGTPATNQTLTKLRAEVVADGLVAKGVDRQRIVLQPKGSIGGDPGIESRRVMIEFN